MAGMVYFCDLGNGAWVAYICSGGGLTDCEWLVPGTGGWIDPARAPRARTLDACPFHGWAP
jgi:hypothetical protein